MLINTQLFNECSHFAQYFRLVASRLQPLTVLEQFVSDVLPIQSYPITLPLRLFDLRRSELSVCLPDLPVGDYCGDVPHACMHHHS